MQIVKLSFKTDKGNYSFYTNSEKFLSLLADDIFTDTIVDAKTGKIINHGAEIEKALGIKKTTEQEKEDQE